MLARLQRTLVLSALGTTLLAAILLAAWDQYSLAYGIVVLAFTAHAGALAVQFLVAARVNAHDPGPTASSRDLLSAWWSEATHAPRAFCWRQPFRSERWPDQAASVRDGTRGIVLIHGFICNRGLWNRWMPALRDAGIPHIAVNLEPIFSSIDDYRQVIEGAVAELESTTGLAPVIVAHSMGGLAARRWWVDTDPARIHRLITRGTPHHGTSLARWALSKNGRQMQLDSPWQRELALMEGVPHATRMTCFYSHCDNMVFPASTATYPGADNRHLRGVAHVHMADHPEPLVDAIRQARPV